MAENGRLGKLEGVINAFKIMMAGHRGEVTCEVITAKPLDQAQRQNLEAALKVILFHCDKQKQRFSCDSAIYMFKFIWDYTIDNIWSNAFG